MLLRHRGALGPYLALKCHDLPPALALKPLAQNPEPQGAAEGLELLPFAKQGSEAPQAVVLGPELGAEPPPEALWCLSPEVMDFGDGLWLMALGPTLSYWKGRAAQLDTGLAALWRRVLDRLFGSAPPGVLAPDPGYRAAIAGHPWAAVLLLEAQAERNLGGLVTAEGRRGGELWQRCSWGAWDRALARLTPHLEERKGFKAAGFRRQRTRLLQAVHRLGLDRPQEARILPAQGIGQRYGGLLADLWALSFGQSQPEADPFPWKPLAPKPPAQVRRVLEYNIFEWEAAVPFLIEDLDRLADLAPERQVLALGWRVWLEDGDPLELELDFRHPHALEVERGQQKTALTRAQLVFEAARLQSFRVEEGREEVFFEAPPMIGWELSLLRSVEEPNLMLDLFGGLAAERSELEALASLENLLEVPLQRYAPVWDWLPEDSYEPWGSAGDSEAVLFEPSLLDAARQRPLFLRREAVALEGPPWGAVFCESVSAKWWGLPGTVAREYFRFRRGPKWFWGYRDERGDWFEQGVFG
ncbi:MAG: hypothetical protein RRB13_06440 [bacterium]|nr:hypothetical protein [bacterium]